MRRFLLNITLLILMITLGLSLPAEVAAADKFLAVVITGDIPRYRQAHESFMEILRKGGMTDEQIEVFVQRPNPDPVSWANSIRKAVGVGADLIITYGAPATLEAKKQVKRIPILFADVGDPVALGIVKGLATPGGNISGVSSKTPIKTLLKNFRSAYKAKSLGIIYSKQDKEAVLQVQVMEKLSREYGFKVVSRGVMTYKEVIPAFDSISSRIDSLFVPHCAVLEPNLQELVDHATATNIPTISQAPGLAEKGAFMTVIADPLEQGQLVGVHALQILNGQKAFTLPVRTPKKVSFIVNMKTVKKLNLKVPFETLSGATRVIK